jgi:uncharacterized protein YkwD
MRRAERSLFRPFGAVALLLPLSGCAPPGDGLREPDRSPSSVVAASVDAQRNWSTTLYSPAPTESPLALAGCGSWDARLQQVAERAGQRASSGQAAFDLGQEVAAAGVPQLWPRGFTVRFQAGEPPPTAVVEAWLARVPHSQPWRCGLAVVSGTAGERLLSVVALEVLAELDALPRQPRLGQWAPLTVHLQQAAASARVIVTGPDQAPYVLPSTVHGSTLRAQFVARQAGTFRIQIVPDFATGPLPALEITCFVDVALPLLGAATPGHSGLASVETARAELYARLNAARAQAQLQPLALDPELARLAQAHAEHMASQLTLAHNVGDGPPTQRVLDARLPATWVSENLAHAPDAESAHATLWNSPSHRANLLHARFTSVGIGAARGSDGKALWFCELFATLADDASVEIAEPTY